MLDSAAMTSTPAPAQTLWRRFIADPQARVGLILVGTFVLLACFAGSLAPLDPSSQFPQGTTELGLPRPPGYSFENELGERVVFRLGSDNLGRDQLSRLLFGARISLIVGAAAMLTAVLLGAAIGLAAGFFRGWLETVLMRLVDVMMTIPTLILAIAFAAVWKLKPIHLPWFGGQATIPGELVKLLVVIGLVSWTGIARVVRSETLRVSALEYVEAARAIGCTQARILFRHVLPNVLPTIVVLASLGTASTILLDAGLSYLGVGIQPPTPSWGAMIRDGQPYLVTAPWMILGPGLCVLAAILGFNLMGQGLQTALDPHAER